MNKTELFAAISERASMRKDVVAKIWDTGFEIIQESLAAGEAVRLTGQIGITVKEQDERTGKNPKTGEAIKIAARTKISIKPGNELKAAVNKK
jgi:nucleoid DNA-binding protein